MSKKSYFINTIGCQMNVYDSEKIASGLSSLGYIEADSLETADIAIVNTCSVRDKAEQKAFSFLGRLAQLKKLNPRLIIGVSGCVAQQEGKNILKRAPYVDLIFGTHAINKIPELIQALGKNGSRIVAVETTEEIDETEITSDHHPDTACEPPQITRFITIMRGCDNFCSYCVVPYVRGRETSRKPEKIIAEINRWVNAGTREITLLGQNVNSYGKKQGLISFPVLLSQIDTIEKLERIRFTTSHPKDLSPELIYAFKDLKKLCRHIHLPIQSGSNRILKLMNRKYTRESYLENIYRLRETCPGIAITSDMIVGFPGETQEDFEQTLSLMETVEFDGLFAFSYSDRPNAPAAHYKYKIADNEKSKRLQDLLALQEQFTLKKNMALLNQTVPVLVEGYSKKQTLTIEGTVHSPEKRQWRGRTSSNKIVNFASDSNNDQLEYLGKIVNVTIEKALAHSLWGKPNGN